MVKKTANQTWLKLFNTTQVTLTEHNLLNHIIKGVLGEKFPSKISKNSKLEIQA